MLERRDHEGVLELELARPPANAMTTELVATLADAVEGAAAAGTNAVVISGRPKMFSAGLDVPLLLGLDEAGIRTFWSEFFRLMQAVVETPVPVGVALTGHSPAGGAVLALHCDHRVGAKGSFKIGLNEVQVGLPLSENFFHGLRRLVGQRHAQRLGVSGTLIEMDEAAAIGLVDELAEVEEVVPRAVAWARNLTALPPVAMRTTLALARSDLRAVLDRLAPDFAATATRYWFSPETQATMKAMVERLAAKKG
jgi:enoyl-CoA hydratase/carnithine racemase